MRYEERERTSTSSVSGVCAGVRLDPEPWIVNALRTSGAQLDGVIMEGTIQDERASEGKSTEHNSRTEEHQKDVTAPSQGAKEEPNRHQHNESFMEPTDNLLDKRAQGSEAYTMDLVAMPVRETGTEGITGAEPSMTPYNIIMSGQGSHDSSPASKVTDTSHDLSMLETANEGKETTWDEGHVCSDMETVRDESPSSTEEKETFVDERHIGIENREMVLDERLMSNVESETDIGELQSARETASEESEEWETASEESVELREDIERVGKDIETVNGKTKTDCTECRPEEGQAVGDGETIPLELEETNEHLDNEPLGEEPGNRKRASKETASDNEETVSKETSDSSETVDTEASSDIKEETKSYIKLLVSGETDCDEQENADGCENNEKTIKETLETDFKDSDSTETEDGTEKTVIKVSESTSEDRMPFKGHSVIMYNETTKLELETGTRLKETDNEDLKEVLNLHTKELETDSQIREQTSSVPHIENEETSAQDIETPSEGTDIAAGVAETAGMGNGTHIDNEETSAQIIETPSEGTDIAAGESDIAAEGSGSDSHIADIDHRNSTGQGETDSEERESIGETPGVFNKEEMNMVDASVHEKGEVNENHMLEMIETHGNLETASEVSKIGSEETETGTKNITTDSQRTPTDQEEENTMDNTGETETAVIESNPIREMITQGNKEREASKETTISPEIETSCEDQLSETAVINEICRDISETSNINIINVTTDPVERDQACDVQETDSSEIASEVMVTACRERESDDESLAEDTETSEKSSEETDMLLKLKVSDKKEDHVEIFLGESKETRGVNDTSSEKRKDEEISEFHGIGDKKEERLLSCGKDTGEMDMGSHEVLSEDVRVINSQDPWAELRQELSETESEKQESGKERVESQEYEATSEHKEDVAEEMSQMLPEIIASDGEQEKKKTIYSLVDKSNDSMVSDPSAQCNVSLVQIPGYILEEQMELNSHLKSIDEQPSSEIQFLEKDLIFEEQHSLSDLQDIFPLTYTADGQEDLQSGVQTEGPEAGVMAQNIQKCTSQDQEALPCDVFSCPEDLTSSLDTSDIELTHIKDVGDGDSQGLCEDIIVTSSQETTGFFLKDTSTILYETAVNILQVTGPVSLEDNAEMSLLETEQILLHETPDSSSQHAAATSKATGTDFHKVNLQVMDKGGMITVSDMRDETDNVMETDEANKMLLTRKRSNTDPLRSHARIVKSSSLRHDSSNEGSIQDQKKRSVTPPCDYRQCLPASESDHSYPANLENTTVEPEESTMKSELGQDGNISNVQTTTTGYGGEASKEQFVFYPTQILNPILLLNESPEEKSFYSQGNLSHDLEDNENKDSFYVPQDTEVVLTGNESGSVTEESMSPHPSLLASSAKETTLKQPPAQSISPLWLPPRRSRHVGSPGDISKTKEYLIPGNIENHLVRRATIRHKKGSYIVTGKAGKRHSAMIFPTVEQKENSKEPRTDNQKTPPLSVTRFQVSPLPQTKLLFRQQKLSEYEPQTISETGQRKDEKSMGKLTEKEEEAGSKGPEVIHREKHNRDHTPLAEASRTILRRHSKLLNSTNLLYQEYSDVALNQAIQRQKPQDFAAEEKSPESPRSRRRALSSQESYLQRLSVSSADSLWQDIPKIRGSEELQSMTREEQKLQEAKFELIMSEMLYLRSLNIAVEHFQSNPELHEVLSAQDRQWLFSRLSEVRDASSDFLYDLEEEFEKNMYNFQVCNLVINHEPNFRRVYLPYVTNQSYQDRTFQRLLNDNPRFQQVLSRLESDPVCQRLSLKSFLILPFQRITRLRLLLQNILKRSVPGSDEELQATEAHNALEKLIRDCNESVQKMKDTEELILLNQKIQFECKIFPLISSSRRLVKHGEVSSLEFNSLSFKWKVTARPVYLHLFNDCLLLSRLREGGRFVVFDYGNAADIRVERCEMKLHGTQKNVFRVFLRESAAGTKESGQEGRGTEYIFRTETQSQKLRWILALSPPKEETDFLKYHGLSQMQCLKSYKSRENDELSLDKADIILVTQRSEDGWVHGVRLSDMQSGWFPQSHVQSISRHACIKNLEEEQRLQTARAKLQPFNAK
ncbi:uncharacterized protein WCC33_011271 [Rhinophrynus dorsalis]